MAFDAGAIVGRMQLEKKSWDASVAEVKKQSKELEGEAREEVEQKFLEEFEDQWSSTKN